jgi:hypothetical protein
VWRIINHKKLGSSNCSFIRNLFYQSPSLFYPFRLKQQLSFGNEISGIKGYFAIVDMSLDNATDIGGTKELFAASCNFDYSVF